MIHLLRLKKITLHFTNPLVNVALKFWCREFNFTQLQLLKVKTRRKSPEFTPALEKIKGNLGE